MSIIIRTAATDKEVGISTDTLTIVRFSTLIAGYVRDINPDVEVDK